MTRTALLWIGLVALTVTARQDIRADTPDPGNWSAIAIVQAVEAYASAWRSNDPDAVIAAFTEDFTLSPSGMPFVEGAEAARRFWWPAGAPAARIVDFRIRPVESSEHGSMGYVRGHYELEFEYQGAVTATRGKFLSILERRAGVWKIRHHYWDTLPHDSQP